VIGSEYSEDPSAARCIALLERLVNKFQAQAYIDVAEKRAAR
jgi:hypothetical protein